MFHLMTAFCMQTYKMVLPNDRLQDIRFALSRIRDDASLRTGYMVLRLPETIFGVHGLPVEFYSF